jgi:hypothetical protein
MSDNKDSKDNKVQGEGDYEAGRRYDEKTKQFVESGRVEQAAEDAAPRNSDEAEAMRRAEEIGKSKRKEEDPSVARPDTNQPESPA